VGSGSNSRTFSRLRELHFLYSPLETVPEPQQTLSIIRVSTIGGKKHSKTIVYAGYADRKGNHVAIFLIPNYL
jgi:hypothetical protein